MGNIFFALISTTLLISSGVLAAEPTRILCGGNEEEHFSWEKNVMGPPVPLSMKNPPELGDPQMVYSGTEASYTGAITQDAICYFRKLPKEIKKVNLYSGGGFDLKGRFIGEMLRQRGISTHVDQFCASSCVSIFVGGIRRTISPGAVLMVHSGAKAATPDEITSYRGVAQHFKSLGVSHQTVIQALYPPDSKYARWFTADESLGYGLVHEIILDVPPPVQPPIQPNIIQPDYRFDIPEVIH
jgi:ATP-dependent protease ClpP protease subunit